MTDRMFRYYREDFRENPVRVIHMDLVFDVFDDRTRVTSDLHLESRDLPIADLMLNARDLEILAISCPEFSCSYQYERENNLLRVRFDPPVPPREQFTVHSETICRPTKNILEGLYYDETPPGAPPQQVTQCQQWGFQRLVPCIDDMTAKCTYTTTIIADTRYTNLITNGDLVSPREPAGPGRVKCTYENKVTPMAPYLFFLGCGTFATFIRECEYPDGHRCTLELLVPPGSDPGPANFALDILHDAILWVHLFTGPGRFEHESVRERLYRLLRDMERLKMQDPHSPRLAAIRGELGTLAGRIKPGYAYTGTTYREIAMQNSDFGGMENVGNTTISANRIMPFPGMTDPGFEYLARVKAHEFYHNLNGSEVTGWSPFEIWLNEAVTVYVENQYHAFHFGEDYSRLQEVLSLIAPAGTLELDGGAASLPIEPEGFNDPNELITDITYKKAPEFVRMIGTLMGKEAFVRGLDLYHRRYRHGNATRAQWVEAMEEVSGSQFASMADGWLQQTGFPTLTVTAAFDPGKKLMTLHLSQEGDRTGKRWIFPFRAALVDAAGNNLAEVLHRVELPEEVLEIPVTGPPAFLSLNRGFTFYGKVAYDVPAGQLYLQARHDSDMVNRCLAFMAIVDREKIRMLEDPDARPDEACLDLWFELLSDRDLMMNAGVQLLSVFESAPDPRYAHRYQALYDVRERILRALAERYTTGLTEIYDSVRFPDARRVSLDQESPAIRRRQIQNYSLGILSRLDTPDIHQMIRDQFADSLNASDKLSAFALYLDGSAQDRHAMLDSFMKESQKNPVNWENFLAVVAGNSSKHVLDLIACVERSGSFRIEQANDQRALYGRFALNRKKSLQTGAGRAFLQKTLLTLAPVNEHSTVSMLRVFGPLDAMEEADQVPLVGILARLLAELDPAKTPSVCNTARRILAGAPHAVERYERQHGRIPETGAGHDPRAEAGA